MRKPLQKSVFISSKKILVFFIVYTVCNLMAYTFTKHFRVVLIGYSLLNHYIEAERIKYIFEADDNKMFPK